MDTLASAVERILADPAASDWLKSVLISALARDPVDATNDACTLLTALEAQAAVALRQAPTKPRKPC